jgi:glutamyl-tRNA synthetase
LGWSSPAFAHVGLLCNQDGQKLSKRHGDIDITSFRDKGILPVALLNYAVLLGWSPGRGVKGTSEVMDLNEMIEKVRFPSPLE